MLAPHERLALLLLIGDMEQVRVLKLTSIVVSYSVHKSDTLLKRFSYKNQNPCNKNRIISVLCVNSVSCINSTRISSSDIISKTISIIPYMSIGIYKQFETDFQN